MGRGDEGRGRDRVQAGVVRQPLPLAVHGEAAPRSRLCRCRSVQRAPRPLVVRAVGAPRRRRTGEAPVPRNSSRPPWPLAVAAARAGEAPAAQGKGRRCRCRLLPFALPPGAGAQHPAARAVAQPAGAHGRGAGDVTGTGGRREPGGCAGARTEARVERPTRWGASCRAQAGAALWTSRGMYASGVPTGTAQTTTPVPRHAIRPVRAAAQIVCCAAARGPSARPIADVRGASATRPSTQTTPSASASRGAVAGR